jgi:hypothetical protein
VPRELVLYFQQARPLSQCEAEDGRVVGRLLIDLVRSKPKDLAHTVHMFAKRTAMLRECGFRHIGAMLARLLSDDSQGGPDDDAAISAHDPSSVTEQQATAIGSAITSSVRRSHVPATALKQIVKSHPVLRFVKSEHVWFVPMLETVTVMVLGAAEPRRSTMRQLSSIFTRDADVIGVAPIDVASSAGGGDEESGFSSVVRLGAHRTAYHSVRSRRFHRKRDCRVLRMFVRARSSSRRSKRPVQPTHRQLRGH